MEPSADLITAIKETIKFFKRKTGTKIPIGQFFKRIEYRYKIKLNKRNKEEILYDLKEKGIINILKSTNGKEYVVFGELDFY